MAFMEMLALTPQWDLYWGVPLISLHSKDKGYPISMFTEVLKNGSLV